MQVAEIHARFILECGGVSIDTRTIQPKDLFVALEGDQVDGHEYVEQAVQKGAAIVLAKKGRTLPPLDEIIWVEDPLKTLQDLAQFHRRKFTGKVIALTGSNGKTTTKELLREVLAQSFHVQATRGNYNNHIGVPLTLLSMPLNLDFAIVEMGANHQREIAFLSEICEPDYGFITNYGKAHLKGFGGVDGIIKGKSELYDFLSKHSESSVFYDVNDAMQEERSNAIGNRITFNCDHSSLREANLYCNASISAGFLVMEWGAAAPGKTAAYEAETRLQGIYNRNNAAYAILVGRYLGVPDDQIKEALEAYTPNMNRSQWMETDRNSIIVDCYNANPNSTQAALEHLQSLEQTNRTLILGDMLELGEYTREEHYKILQMARTGSFAAGLFVGPKYCDLRTEFPEFMFFRDGAEAREWITQNPIEKATILLKGSRGIRLEQLIEVL